MRLVFAILLAVLSQAVIATTVSVEVEDSALRLRALYRDGEQVAHILQHIDLLTAAGGARNGNYNLFAAEFSLPLHMGIALGALKLGGTALLLYRPLAYSAQSTQHYRGGDSVRADTDADRPNRYGLSLSHGGEGGGLTLQLSGYADANDTGRVFINWMAMLSFVEWLEIEQWSALVTIPAEEYDDWWFQERIYFTGTHFFTHALRVHLRPAPAPAHHAVCSAFLQHSAFHTPQYAFSCAAQLRWKAEGEVSVASGGETHAFVGMQSEYYADETGGVDDEWLIARLRHRQYIGDDAALTIEGEVGAYKPSDYYRRISFANAIPHIALLADWDHWITIGSGKSGMRYGTEVDFVYDWREQSGMRARLRLYPRLSFTVGALLLLQLRAGVVYEELSGWEEFGASAKIAFNTGGVFRATLSTAYKFDIPDRHHRELTIGGRIDWRAAKHLRLYASAAADALKFSEIGDLEYRIGLSGNW